MCMLKWEGEPSQREYLLSFITQKIPKVLHFKASAKTENGTCNNDNNFVFTSFKTLNSETAVY